MGKSITVIGGGSWATALVKIFSECEMDVTWLVRDDQQASQIMQTGSNPKYLSFASLNINYINAVTDMEWAIKQSELILFAVPSAYLQQVTSTIEPEWMLDKQLAVSIKGFVKGAGVIPSRFLQNLFPESDSVIVIGGPCHAEEIAMERNTYVTIAAREIHVAQQLSENIHLKYINPILNDDPEGVEYVAILKNIIGIATGIANGLNYGENFQAVLTSNAMREIKHFLGEVSPRQRDLFDSAYYGDLLVTAYSEYSRNRTLGKLVGRGIKVSNALNVMEMVAEGYNASNELAPLVKYLKADFPVINSIYRILHQHASPFHEFKLIEKYLR